MESNEIGEHLFADGPKPLTDDLRRLGMPDTFRGEFLLTKDKMVELDDFPIVLNQVQIELARRSVQYGSQIYLRTEEFPDGSVLFTWQTERFFDAPVPQELPDSFRR